MLTKKEEAEEERQEYYFDNPFAEDEEAENPVAMVARDHNKVAFGIEGGDHADDRCSSLSKERICPLKVLRYHNSYQNTAL